jgi:glycosyltransferase involved in cell wall biosynthesis
MKRVLFFGFYDRKYSRTKILKNGFTRNGWVVEECHVDTRQNRGAMKYLKLLMLGLSARKRSYDLVLVPFPGHAAVPIARLVFGRRIIFDAFLSLYESNVLDRKHYSANSWQAKRDRLLDTWGCKLARRVLMDTESNIGYFVREFGLPREKFIRVFVGADDEVFFPVDTPEPEKFTVHFHGTFIPVQGIQYIIEAANILRNEDIHFRIIGHGQESERLDAEIKRLGLENRIERSSKVPIEKVAEYMANSHVVLGLFGPIDRALRAIPNKVYEAMAMGKAIITEDGSGIRELASPETMFKLVPPAEGKAIAAAILELKGDEVRRHSLGKAAREYFESELMPEKIIKELLVSLGKA